MEKVLVLNSFAYSIFWPFTFRAILILLFAKAYRSEVSKVFLCVIFQTSIFKSLLKDMKARDHLMEGWKRLGLNIVSFTIYCRKQAGTVVSLAANIACLLSVLLKPYMPEISETIQSQLNAPSKCNVVYKDFVCHLPPGHIIGTVSKGLFEPLLVHCVWKKYRLMSACVLQAG